MGPFAYWGSTKHSKKLWEGIASLLCVIFFPWLHDCTEALSRQLKELEVKSPRQRRERFVSSGGWTQWVNCSTDTPGLFTPGDQRKLLPSGWGWEGFQPWMALTVEAELSGRRWAFHRAEHRTDIQMWSLALNSSSLQLRFSTERRSKVLIFWGFRSGDSLRSSFAKMPFFKDNLLPLVNQTGLVSHSQGRGEGKTLSEQLTQCQGDRVLYSYKIICLTQEVWEIWQLETQEQNQN